MNLIRWQPFPELTTLRQAMDRLFEDTAVSPWHFNRLALDGAEAPIDMYHTDESVVVKASIPGVKPEDVDISITGDTLTIKGETKSEEEVKEEHYFRKERRYGAFSRSIQLPTSLKTDKAEATFDNGVLTLTIPKAEKQKPKQIKVKPKGVIEGKKK